MAPTPAPRRPAAAGLGLLAVLCALAAGALFALAVHTSRGQRIDDLTRGGEALSAFPRASAATARLLDTISVSSLLLFGLGIMAFALLRGRPWLAAGAGAVVAGANLTTQALKGHFDRPDLVDGGPTIAGAWPSGHATVAMSLAMALVLVAPAGLRWTTALGGCAYATAVGLAVIALDWHRPSEVVGAYLVAVGWTAAVAALLVAAGEGAGAGERRGGSGAGALAALAIGLAFAAVVGVTAARRADVVRLVDDRTAFTAAALACGAACALLGGALARLLQRADSDKGAHRHADR